MSIKRRILPAVTVTSAALAGNWLGARLHATAFGRPAHGIVYRHVDEHGRKTLSVPESANFYPALLCGGAGKPRWAYTFLGGLVISLVLGDALQDRLMTQLAQRLRQPKARRPTR